MVEEVSLPLSALNALPGVSGIEDVVLQIPDEEDIQDVVTAEVPPAVEETLQDVDPEAILEDSLEVSQDPEELAGLLATELPEALERVDVDVEAGLFGPTEEDLEGIISGTLEPPEPVGEARTLDTFALISIANGEETVQGVSPAEAEAELERRGEVAAEAREETGRDLFEITALNPAEAVQQLTTDLETVLTDIQEGINSLVDGLLEGGEDLFGDLTGVVEDALFEAFPEIDGVPFLDDPVTFLGEGVAQGIDQVVEEDTRQRVRTVGPED